MLLEPDPDLACETEPCIGVGHAGSYEDIATTERRTDSIQTAKHVGFAVEIFVRSHVAAPAAIHDGGRRVRTVRGAPFNFRQIVECFQHGLAGGCGIERTVRSKCGKNRRTLA